MQYNRCVFIESDIVFDEKVPIRVDGALKETGYCHCMSLCILTINPAMLQKCG